MEINYSNTAFVCEPAAVKIIEERTVGPSMGRESIIMGYSVNDTIVTSTGYMINKADTKVCVSSGL